MFVFEISWEVCNKVGGIYTVISSKNKLMQEKYGEGYFAIGPYESEEHFIPEEVPELFKDAFNELRERGINCHYGRWDIDGNPKTILIDFNYFCREKDYIKTQLWNEFKIDSLGSDFNDFDRPVIWSWAIGMLIEKIRNRVDDPIVVQTHEWMCGTALLYLKMQKAKVAKVFTTHATMLGRTLIGNNQDLYSIQSKIKPEEEAKRYGILSKFHVEKQSALNADIFTTVSDITAEEATHLLGKKPDVITYNGLDFSILPKSTELDKVRYKSRTRLLEFVKAMFPRLNIDDVSLLAIYGRYEVKSKGIDAVAKAMSILNSDTSINKPIICFFFIPGGTSGIRQEVLSNMSSMNKAKAYFEERKEHIFLDLMNSGKAESAKYESDAPSIRCTHYLPNEEHDSILGLFNLFGLNNDSNIKCILFPVYLNGKDGILNLDYVESLAGIDLGLFPSLYEPWGYTPLETSAMGVPSITSNLAGFGRFIEKNNADGIVIIDRVKEFNKASEELAMKIKDFINLSEDEKLSMRIKARGSAEMANWRSFILNYYEAYQKALNRINCNI
ncbi:glycogen/starch synthase [Candidatus Woesearchaeota archaeon]|nr:glycogen/starch synthase [Candidatus Woesearchaeota archaeon]